ncbi:MAG: hypothetical protein WDW36_005409 [Sanguina aurantia]
MTLSENLSLLHREQVAEMALQLLRQLLDSCSTPHHRATALAKLYQSAAPTQRLALVETLLGTESLTESELASEVLTLPVLQSLCLAPREDLQGRRAACRLLAEMTPAPKGLQMLLAFLQDLSYTGGVTKEEASQLRAFVGHARPEPALQGARASKKMVIVQAVAGRPQGTKRKTPAGQTGADDDSSVPAQLLQLLSKGRTAHKVARSAQREGDQHGALQGQAVEAEEVEAADYRQALSAFQQRGTGPGTTPAAAAAAVAAAAAAGGLTAAAGKGAIPGVGKGVGSKAPLPCAKPTPQASLRVTSDKPSGQRTFQRSQRRRW